MTAIDATELAWQDRDSGTTAFRRKELATAADADDIGCSLYELPPGGRSWPYHYHTANEEAMYVLDGAGSVETPDGTIRVAAGSYVTFPADEAGAHRVVNDGDDPLRYLMLSTMREPEVTVYPESGVFGVFVGSPPGGRAERTLHGYYDVDDTTAYPEG
ncbi:MAG: cupin domain-containing protein [Halobacteriota archaeon]